jgi:hypothetical protein
MGSTFAVELPIFNRSVDHPAAQMDVDAVVAFTPTLQPRPRIRGTNSARLLPVEDVSEDPLEHHSGGIEGDENTLSILIVDDSSPNRSGYCYRSVSLSSYLSVR